VITIDGLSLALIAAMTAVGNQKNARLDAGNAAEIWSAIAAIGL